MNELIIYTIPQTKSEQSSMAAQFVEQVKNGDVSPLDAVAKMKSLQEVITAFLKNKDVVSAVLNECDKYGKGETPTSNGAAFTVKETGVKYDFSGCGDPVWNRLKEESDRISEQMKEREQYLKIIKGTKTEIDEETGEVYTLNQPTRTSTTSFAITFKK